ncbi:probable protein phosphatase 2C 66 [Rutidosis leptorrhynchoides]|uniref:probable protein phosphatase 2C 66 n=1 Tax=Rutidosis leptorrhynchoides TaxID=125765 RepID=UPI003A9982E7
MGACYSTTTKYKQHDPDDKWWKSQQGSNKTIRTPTDFKFIFSGAGGRTDERLLHHVPGRLYNNGSCSTACLHTQQGKKGTNQDAMIFWEKFNSKSDALFCGVFDGHGPCGHMVARKVRDLLPVILSTQWMDSTKIDPNCDDENGNVDGNIPEEELLEEYWCEQSDVEEKDTIPEKYLPLKKSILKSFKLIDKELKDNPSIDCFCSGTTAVTLIKQGQDLVIGNIGDSRAVLATRDDNNSLVAVQLTIDLKPNLPREAARIQQFNGRVFALQDEPEVSRVWLPHSDTPGLAMARAFGDFCLKDFGLISVPDVFYHHIIEKDEFVILATDGVWDVLSNKEAVDIVAAAPSRPTAARALVDCATRAWKLKYPTSKNDDCAVVCLYLDQKPAPISPEPPVKQEVKKPDIDSNLTQQEAIVDEPALEHSGTIRECSEIVADIESNKETVADNSIGVSKRSLAECISTTEDEGWSALEGVTRANSLLSIPRFFSHDKRSVSWRKSTSKK